MSQNESKPNTVSRQLYVKKGQTFGKTYVEFGVTEMFDLSSGQDQRSAYAKLMAIVQFEIDRYAEDFLRAPQEYGNAVGNVSGAPAASAAVTERAIEIVVEVREGKPQYRIKTQSMPKFGVPVYPDMKDFDEIKRMLGDAFSVDASKYLVTHVPQGKGRKAVEFALEF